MGNHCVRLPVLCVIDVGVFDALQRLVKSLKPLAQSRWAGSGKQGRLRPVGLGKVAEKYCSRHREGARQSKRGGVCQMQGGILFR